MISFFGVLLVFGTLLTQALYHAFYTESKRPKVISCLLLTEDQNNLITQLEKESDFVDRFIIVQPQASAPLSEEIKKELKQKYQEKITFLSFQLTEEDQVNSWHVFSKIEKLKAFTPCQNRDVIVMRKQGQSLDFTRLYQALNQISQDESKMYELGPQSIQAVAYGALKSSSMKHFWSHIKTKPSKRRNFFFQTSRLESMNEN